MVCYCFLEVTFESKRYRDLQVKQSRIKWSNKWSHIQWTRHTATDTHLTFRNSVCALQTKSMWKHKTFTDVPYKHAHSNVQKGKHNERNKERMCLFYVSRARTIANLMSILDSCAVVVRYINKQVVVYGVFFAIFRSQKTGYTVLMLLFFFSSSEWMENKIANGKRMCSKWNWQEQDEEVRNKVAAHIYASQTDYITNNRLK